jgi:hypothetical protein
MNATHDNYCFIEAGQSILPWSDRIAARLEAGQQ